MEFKNLGRYQTSRRGSKLDLEIPLPKTPDGRVYRYSPNEAAHPRHFVLGDVKTDVPLTEELRARMKHEPHSPMTVCPYSGVSGDTQAFTHPDDIKAAREIAQHAALNDMQDELSKAFSGINRRGSKGLFSITVAVKSQKKPKPRFRRRDLMRLLVCDHCGRDYGVYAIALFCPDCGAPNLRLHFAREVDLVGQQVTLAEGLNETQEELAYRLLGNAHEDVLTAFEATLKTVYLFKISQRPADTPPIKTVGNAFQNIDRATERFAEFSFDPFAGLEGGELDALKLNIQKRHVIGHNLGIVDDKFATMANDARVGETVHLVGEDIRLFAAISQKVVDHLDGFLVGAVSPASGTGEILVEAAPPPPEDPRGVLALDLDLSPFARELALWVAETSPGGLRDFVDEKRLRSDFEGKTEQELGEAIAELQTDGFVDGKSFGGAVPYFRPQLELFETFDPIAFGTDPTADGVELAAYALAGSDAVNVPELFAKTGWTHRRFNPALSYLVTKISGPVSKTYDNEFAVRFFHMNANDRVSLKRFVAAHSSDIRRVKPSAAPEPDVSVDPSCGRTRNAP